MVKIGLINSLTGVIIIYSGLLVPFSIYLLVSFFRSLPSELFDAAAIDGCSSFDTLWRITLPLSTPPGLPVMTKTYASTLTALHLLLLEIFNASASYFDALAAVADICETALGEAKKIIPDLVPVISKFEHGFYFGAGNAYAASLEGALKMKEMAILHAEGSETWEMASGPATVVSEKSLCVALYTGEETDSVHGGNGAACPPMGCPCAGSRTDRTGR